MYYDNYYLFQFSNYINNYFYINHILNIVVCSNCHTSLNHCLRSIRDYILSKSVSLNLLFGFVFPLLIYVLQQYPIYIILVFLFFPCGARLRASNPSIGSQNIATQSIGSRRIAYVGVFLTEAVAILAQH